MTKIVYNACFGGFGLSKEAVQRYQEKHPTENRKLRAWFDKSR